MLDTPANVPATVTVVFPRADDEALGTSVYAISVTLASLSLAEYGDEVGRVGNHLVHSAAVANFTGGGTPVNDAELQTLAEQVATDFYLWRLASVNAKYRGLLPWTCDGMHDVEYLHGATIATSVFVSRWEPDFANLKHAGAYGSSDVPVTGGGGGGITHVNGETGPEVTIGLGRANYPLVPKINGEAQPWQSYATYRSGDVVKRSGVTYRCILLNTNEVPPNATYWTALPGEAISIDIPAVCSVNGNYGYNITIGIVTSRSNPPTYDGISIISSGDIPAYSGSVHYTEGMAVSYGGSVYKCIAAVTGTAPPSGSWLQVYNGVANSESTAFALYIPPAAPSIMSGFVTNEDQTFAGGKTFEDEVISNFGFAVDAAGAVIRSWFMSLSALYSVQTTPGNYSLLLTPGSGIRTIDPTASTNTLVMIPASWDPVQDIWETEAGVVLTYIPTNAITSDPGYVNPSPSFQINARGNLFRGMWAVDMDGQSVLGMQVAGGLIVGGTPAVPGTSITPGTLPTSVLAPAFYLPAENAGTVLEAENKSGSTISPGMVVTTDSSGTGFVLADATDIGKSVTGIARESIANTVSGEIQSEGLITLPDWTAATGSATLAAKANYFSDPANPGKLTTTAPTTTGHVSQLVGVAVSDDTMDLILSPPILL